MNQFDNNGISLRLLSDPSVNTKIYRSSTANYTTRRPWFQIDYVTIDNMAEYDTETVDMGRAGTFYLNKYTGTYYVKRTDLSLNGNVSPVEMSFTYDPWSSSVTRGSSYGAYWITDYYNKIFYSQTVTDNDIKIVSCANSFVEGDFCARTIRKMVREDGYRFKDFVIIARDADIYTESVSTACLRNGVSIFYDKRVPLNAFPVAAAVNFAIKSLSLNTEDILNFHKTGLGTLNQEEIYILQNYAYLWNIDGNIWEKAWDMNPAGFKTEDYKTSDVSLDKLNELRIKAITPLTNFKKCFKFNAENRVKAIVNLMRECNFSEKLIELSKNEILEFSQFSSDVLKQSYDSYINILDSLARCYGENDITNTEFSESLTMAVSLSSVGVIPQMLDQVTFGSADRIRPSRPKVAFILGANQGVFPKNTFNNGVFNIAERKALLEFIDDVLFKLYIFCN